VSDTGTIERIRVLANEPEPDDSWTRGLGLSPDIVDGMRVAMRDRFAGKSKTEQQRERMRAAKLDKPKSEQHRANMRATHQQKNARVRQIQERNPQLTFREAYKIDTINQRKNK
jgi:hypothetical protein